MNKSPCFPFYPSDFFGDVKVRVMSADAQAFYLLLLANIWDYDTQYSIPDDEKIIAKLLNIDEQRTSALLLEIRPCLLVHHGRLISSRLKKEKAKQDNYRKLQSDKGKKGGRPQKAVALPQLYNGLTGQKPGESSSKPKPKPKPKPKKEYSDEFLLFYKTYPNRKSPDDAWRAWKKLNGTRPAIETILEAIRKQIEWRENANGDFRPDWKHPATWLNKGCWNDDVSEEIRARPKYVTI